MKNMTIVILNKCCFYTAPRKAETPFWQV